MKYYLVYRKNGRYDPILGDVVPKTESIDQGASHQTSQPIEVFLEVPPLIETTNVAERESVKSSTLTYTAKKFRPFSTELYNEILHKTIPATHPSPGLQYKTSESYEYHNNSNRFKLPISDQYDPEGKKIDWMHGEQRIIQKILQIKSKTEKDYKIITHVESDTFNDENKPSETQVNDVQEDIKVTASKVVKESIEKAVSVAEEIVKEISAIRTKEEEVSLPSSTITVIRQENLSKEKLLVEEASDIPKSVRDTVQLYESIDIQPETTKEDKPEDERKLYLLQEIEESIEQGSVKRKSTIFENEVAKLKHDNIIKDRQIKKSVERKVSTIGSETIAHIKKAAESSLSKSSLKVFFLYLTNVMLALTRCIPHTFQSYNRSRKVERQEFTSNLLTEDNQQTMRRRKLSGADIAQLVSRKPKDLTQRMDNVISEFHSKLHINNYHSNVNDRRAKSCSRIDEVTNCNNTFEWLAEMDSEERELVKKKIKVATLAAARRVLGRRRSYHHLSDFENEADGLTYIAIVESHVYTNKNAIIDDYISNVKAQVNNVLEITDINEMETVAAESLTSQSFKFSKNRRDFQDVCMNTEEAFRSKDVCIDAVTGQRIDYVATVTVEHKQLPMAINIQKDENTLNINKFALNEATKISNIVKENEETQSTAKRDNTIDMKRTENLKVEEPPPIIEEMEYITVKELNEATASQTSEVFKEDQNESIEITEVKEQLPLFNLDLKQLIFEEVEKENVNKYVTSVADTNFQVIKEAVASETTGYFDEIEDGLQIISEIKEEVPKIITEEEKLNKAQVLNIENIRQICDVFSEVDIKEGDDYNLLKDKGVLTAEIEKNIATKMVNEAYIHEAPTVLPSVEIDSQELAKSTTEVCLVGTALATSHGISNQVTTECDIASVSENVKIEEQTAIPVIETKELMKVQAFNVATTRQTNEVFHDVQNDVTITEVAKELPTITLETDNLRKPLVFGKDVTRQISEGLNILEIDEKIVNHNLLKEMAAEVIEINEYATAHKHNYSNTAELSTIFSQLDVDSFRINESQEEFATISTEIKELIQIQPICNATALDINVKLEESNDLETKLTRDLEQCLYLEVMEEIIKLHSICYATVQDITTNVEEIDQLLIKKAEEEFVTSCLEPRVLYPVSSCCISVVSDITINLYEVEHFDVQPDKEEVANERIELDFFTKAQSVYTEICQEIKILLEEVELLCIDMVTSEKATTKEEDKIFEIALPIATSILTQLNISLTEVDTIANECILEEHASCEEEKRELYLPQAICTPIDYYIELTLEEYNLLEIEEILEELASTCIEPQVFSIVLVICTSISSQTSTIYFEAESLAEFYVQEEKAESSVENNNYFLALSTCNEISQDIDLLLEESNVLETEKVEDEFASTYVEPQMFSTALSVCTPVSSQTSTIYIEAEILPDEHFQKEKAGSCAQKNIYSMALGTCNEIIQDINLLLEECNGFTIDKVEEEFTSMSTEPYVLVNTLPLSTPIFSQINEDYYETQILEIENLETAEVNVLVEVSKLTLILAICIATIEEIYKDLEDCALLKVDEIKEESGNSTEQPFVLTKILPLCFSILEHINISYNNAEVLEIDDLHEEKGESILEAKHFVTILCICTSVAETVITPLNETKVFNVDKVSEYQAFESLQPKIFCKTLSLCTASLFILNVPVLQVTYREPEVFEYKKVSSSLEMKHYETARPMCQAIVKQVDTTFKEAENTSISYDVVEEYAKLSLEAIQLNSAFAVSSATVKQLDFNHDDIAENYETTHLEQEQIANPITETRDLTIAQSIRNATAQTEYVNSHSFENASYNIEEESAVLKIEPKHVKNVVSIQQTNITYEDSNNETVKYSKNKTTENVSLTENNQIKSAKIIKKATRHDNFTHSESLAAKDLEVDDVTYEQVTIIEEPTHLIATEDVNKSIRKNKLNINEASNVYQETNIQSNSFNLRKVSKEKTTDVKSVMVEAEPIIENLTESKFSVHVRQAKENINNEENINVSIRRATAKKDEAPQEMSYKLTLTKPQIINEITSETKEDTIYIRSNKDLKQYHVEQEFQEEVNLISDQNVEEETGVIIQDITDLDENEENSIDVGNETESMEYSETLNLQTLKMQGASENFCDTSTFVKRSGSNKEYNTNQEESAALTIFRKEDIVVEKHIIESYEEENLNSKHVIDATYSNTSSDYMNKCKIVSSQSNFALETNYNKEIVDKEQNNKTLSQSNKESRSVSDRKDTHKEVIGYRFNELEINAHKSQISKTIDGNVSEKSIKQYSVSQESTSSTFVTQELESTVVNKKSKSLSIETNLKQEEIEGSQIHKDESSPEIESPTKPPTPLTDEYIFRLTAPLPKSRGTTPIPREPSPEIIQDNEDLNIPTKNLVPTIESVTIERVVYSPPLPTPPTSPVHAPTYTKPGLNGGTKRLPRYIKPGLRGGSDRPPIPKEEILEVRKNLSILTSDINETLKNIEKYKKIVEILKQQKVEGESSSKMMEEGETAVKQTKTDEVLDTQVMEKESSEQNSIVTEKSIDESLGESINIQPKAQSENMVNINLKDENKIDTVTIEAQQGSSKRTREAEERIKGYNIKEVTSFEEIEKEYENTGIVELAPDTAVEDDSVEKEDNTITAEDFETVEPKSDGIVINKEEMTEKEEEKPGDKVDEEQKTADEEVARVTELSTEWDRSTTKESSPIVTASKETDTIKEAHVISLSRVLSSHMIREGLSPDCQKMKDKFEHRQNILEDEKQKINEEEKNRTWTTFLQKSTHLSSTQKFGHFAYLQDKFEKQEPFTIKLPERSELKISSAIKPRDFNSSPVPWQERALADTLGAPNIEAPEIIPAEEPQYFLAIPTESKDDLKSTVIPLPSPNQQRTHIDVGDDKKEEETLQSKEIKYQQENSEPKVNIAVEVATKEKPQNIKEEETKVTEMPAETKGELLVKDKKRPSFGPQIQDPQKTHSSRPQPKFGWMNPDPRPLKLPGGRRWRRPGEEYSEEQIAETILANSEIIQGKTMGESNCHLVDFHNVQKKVIPSYNKLIEYKELIIFMYCGPRINFMKYEKPPTPLNHLQHSEVYKLIHNMEQTPPKRVEFLRTAIAEADYRERCRSMSPCPPESSKEQKSTFYMQLQP